MLSIFIATHSEKTVLAEGKGRELRQEGHRTEMIRDKFRRQALGWRKHKLESRLLGEISITSDIQMTPPLWQIVTN